MFITASCSASGEGVERGLAEARHGYAAAARNGQAGRSNRQGGALTSS